MSQDHEAEKPKANPLKWALWGVAGIGTAGILYIIGQAAINPRQEMGLKSLAKGEMAKMILPATAGASHERAARLHPLDDGVAGMQRRKDWRRGHLSGPAA